MTALHRLVRHILMAAAMCLPLLAAAQTSTTTTLTTSSTPSVYGSALTLTATVTGSSTPTGTVSFKNGGTTLSVKTLAGTTTFVTNALPVGSHSLTAVYSGDAGNLASTSSTVTQVISAASTTTTLTVSPASAQVGQNVTLQAKLAGGLAPGGTVTFTVGGSSVGTATVTGTAATLSLNNLALGSHTIGASYAGDTNHQSSVAGTTSLTISARSAMTWQYGYDAMGRLNTVVDPNALANYTYYDGLGRAIQTQQPANTGSMTPTVIDYGYDLQNALTSVTDPRLLTTTYTVKGLATVVQQSSPDTATSSFTYDAKGQVLTSTDARGKTTTFAYDALSRPTSISYPSGTATSFEYDGGASPYAAAKGELTKITDESGNTVFAYDSMGRLGTKTVVIGSKTFTVTYGWANSGSATDKLTAITYPSGTRVNYAYDSYGSVSGVSVNSVNGNGIGVSGTTTTVLGSVTYSAENKISGWNWSGGLARTIGYDSYGQVSSYTLGDPNGSSTAAGSLRTLTRDAAGRITAYAHTNNASAVSALAQSFSYDNLSRLTANTQSGTSFAYSYDATGNRATKSVGGSSYTNTVSVTSNRLTQTQDTLGTASQSYDAAGNIVGDGVYTFGYSDRGRLASVVTGSGTVTYTINGMGQRARKLGPGAVVPSGAAYYVYDEAGQLLGEYDANGAPVYETIYLGSMPVGALKHTGSAGTSDLAAVIYNVHADHIATPRLITKQDHTIVWRWDTSEAFGATAPNQNPSSLGTFVYNQRFPGQIFDAETGLFQNWNREYDAQTGRYRQSDPIGLTGGINTYAYVNGSPLAMIDQRGLFVNAETGEAWATAQSPRASAAVNQETGQAWTASLPIRRSYDPNDVRGGFDSRGNSSVYNPRNYDPSAASKVLILTALNIVSMAPAMCAAASTLGVASGVGRAGPMQIERLIQRGEKVVDLINEAKALTFTTGNEFAVVTLANGQRALVSGGPGGINFAEGAVTRIFGHTHPTNAMPSAADVSALGGLGQSKQYVFHGGQTSIVRRHH